MSTDSNDWLARYLPWRRWAEPGFWVLVLGLQAGFNSANVWLDLQRAPHRFAPWEPAAWEFSSALAIGLLIPAVVAFERRFPLRWATLPRHLGWHLLGSLVFCLGHMGAMVAVRHGVYGLLGRPYSFDWAIGLYYEYLKDVRTYAMVLVAVLSYRLLLLRAQGEARVLDAPEPAAGTVAAPVPAPVARPERFLVRKLRKEFLVAAADIEWLQAQGNYLGLHVNGHDYLLRSTLGDFLAQLDPARFVQVHRSYAVNLDRIAEITPTDGGDAKLKMKDGSQLPCSRRYRDALRG
jgi:hypothetical protein